MNDHVLGSRPLLAAIALQNNRAAKQDVPAKNKTRGYSGRTIDEL